MPATVTLEALPGHVRGRVVEIGASALPQTGAQAAAREFRVKIRLDGPAPAAARPDVRRRHRRRRTAQPIVVPLQAVVERNGKTGVFVSDGDVVRFTPITTGIIGGLSIEVTA